MENGEWEAAGRAERVQFGSSGLREKELTDCS